MRFIYRSLLSNIKVLYYWTLIAGKSENINKNSRLFLFILTSTEGSLLIIRKVTVTMINSLATFELNYRIHNFQFTYKRTQNLQGYCTY